MFKEFVLNLQPSRLRQAMKNRVNMVAVGIFVVLLARTISVYISGRRLGEELMSTFDVGKDALLQGSELTKLLKANGMNFTSDQVSVLFGGFDDEHNGYDQEELTQILNILGDLPSASKKIRDIASTTDSGQIDLALTVIVGCGVMYLLTQQKKAQEQLAGRKFLEVVRMRKQQAASNLLRQEVEKYSDERADLMGQIKQLQSGSEETEALKERLAELDRKKAEAEKRLAKDLSEWQKKAEDAMQESTLAKNKMESVMACISGIEAFNGCGKGETGAQAGFSQKKEISFSSSVITFGTIENGMPLMFETDPSKKLGEGADCAYKAKDLQTGKEYALKLYTLRNNSQRRQINNDLAAYTVKLGSHPRVVSYERVIESQEHIFVLMQLIKGCDLFDMVVSRGFKEHEAKPLFWQHVEGLEFLHEKGVIHCDVKPENAMVVGDIDKGTAELVLIDFGFSCFSNSAASPEAETGGSLNAKACVPVDRYQAPEHLADPACEPKPSTDMWRLGCLLFIMLVRNTPWNQDMHTQVGIRARQEGKFMRLAEYNALTADARDLIEKLMAGDPTKRPSCADVYKHPWLNDCDMTKAKRKSSLSD